VEPEVFVRDMHPGYLSSRIAEDLARERGGAEVLEVQHHHAHVAAVMAEHGRTSPVVGLAFDGTGWGPDGTVWGGECLVADLQGYRRAGRLRPAPMPGGDLAARRPWRAALGYASLCPESELGAMALAFGPVDPRERAIAERQVERGLNAPWASSVGRLFDAAAAILGLRHASTHEGQAAMELEALATAAPPILLPFPVRDGPAGPELDPVPLLVALGREALAGASRAALAAGFHDALARAAAELAARVARETGLGTVVLGGGVFQNALLLVAVEDRLRRAGLEVLVPRALGPNDGAISYGQAAVAAARLAGPVAGVGSQFHVHGTLPEERS
jgi:hydrogenase maturation protein HypF